MVLVALAFVQPSSNAHAQTATQQVSSSRWLHKASGASFPKELGEQAISKTVDLGSAYDSVVDYTGGGAAESTTVYIFRAAYPDAGLWLDRTLPTIERDIPLAIFKVGSTEALTAFGGAKPNGFQKVYSTNQPGPFKTTGIAVAQAGEYLVKFRVTSAKLDETGLAARIAAFASAIRFPSSVVLAALPNQLPPCTSATSQAIGKRLGADENKLAVGLVAGLVVYRQNRRPLAASEKRWCRSENEVPMAVGTVLRRVDKSPSWVMLVGDAGKAIASISAADLELKEPAATIYASSRASTKGVAFFDNAPSPLTALEIALPVLAGREAGLFEISIGPKGNSLKPKQP